MRRGKYIRRRWLYKELSYGPIWRPPRIKNWIREEDPNTNQIRWIDIKEAGTLPIWRRKVS